MNVLIQGKQLVAVEYPGTVVNVKRMLNTLGGEKGIQTSINDPIKRLELKFRPTDPYSKPAYGDKFTCTNLVVEVVRRKKKTSGESCSVTFDIKCLGTVSSVYKFKTMCDFQLLPIGSTEDGRTESLIPKLVPNDLYPSTWLEEDNVPLFVTPMLYSRFSTSQDIYKDGRQVAHRKPVTVVETNLISSNRPRRPGYAVFCTFDAPEIPQEPVEAAIKELHQYSPSIIIKSKLDELFAERPIWTKNALLSNCNILDKQRIKLPLTCTAYYFSNGPWRTLWVKFGYDPRKDTSAKIYQVMDFRINAAIRIENEFKRSRAFDYYSLPMKAMKIQKKISSIKKDHLLALSQGTQSSQDDVENLETEEPPSYMLIPGRLPCFRQCYFQICDIHLEKVQKLVHQNDGRERFCHEKDGWCDIGVLDKCREVIAREIKITARKTTSKTDNNG